MEYKGKVNGEARFRVSADEVERARIGYMALGDFETAEGLKTRSIDRDMARLIIAGNVALMGNLGDVGSFGSGRQRQITIDTPPIQRAERTVASGFEALELASMDRSRQNKT